MTKTVKRFTLTFRDLPLEELEQRLITAFRRDKFITADYVRLAILTTPVPEFLAHLPMFEYERSKTELEALGYSFLKELGIIIRPNLTQVK